ncbi:MAG: hypothetical protein OJF60_003496 [Burkholderiaceae bacterium]|jgi:hypothetical protein|nr:MAG: hypothetical protein OJF60_003496 [Burkholderiaceae bacterium]
MESIWYWALPAVVLLLLLLVLYVRYMRAPAPRGDRYTSEALITPPQADLLYYLQSAFPGQPVLVDVPLRKMVSIRRADSRRRAEQALEAMKVNFAVCNDAGKVAFAFDIEAYRSGDASAAQREANEKHRILKSAGIRLIYVKDTVRKMPSAEDFRRKLSLSVYSSPGRASQVSVRQQLEERMAQADQDFRTTGFKESEVMGMSKLMGLQSATQDDPDDPWGANPR